MPPDEAKVNEDEQKEAPPLWRVTAEPVGANPALKPEAAKRVGRKRLTAKPEGDDEGDNVGGVVVYVERTRGNRSREEVARVGFVRSTSENPDVPFDVKLDEVLDTARQTAERLNALDPDGGLV